MSHADNHNHSITLFCQGPGVRKNHRGAGEGVRKSKRIVSRKFWGHEEESGKEVLVPLEEPSREEEKVRLEAEKEEFAETLHAVGNEQEKEEYTETAARDSSTIKVTPENSLSGRGCKEEQMNRNRLGEEEGMQVTSFVSNDGGHGIVDQISGGPVHHDDGLEELGRTGDFSNWKTAVVKRDVERREEGLSPTVVERREDENIINQLHE